VTLTICTCSLLTGPRTFESVELVRVCCPAEDAPMACATFICYFLLHRFCEFSRPERPTGSRPVCTAGRVAVPIHSVTNGLRFFQHPLPAIPTTLLAESSASMRRNVGFTMFRSNSDDDLAPAYYTGSRSDPCARTLKADNLTAYRFGGSLSAPLALYI